MKRFISALVFCVSLLLLLSFFLFPPVKAKDDVILTLLNLPAPPPPNPLVRMMGRDRDQKFYDVNNPPKDNAPIEDILDYWKARSGEYRELGYNPKPSEKTIERIFAEIGKDPKMLTAYLNVLPDGDRSAEFVRSIFDREGSDGAYNRSERSVIKQWLTYHSPYFSNDLARAAQAAGDANEYVSNQNELLSLARVDFEKARPIIYRLQSNPSQKVSQVLAKWALYRHALDSDSLGDIETFRDDLKAIVEDRSATDGMRDLALDALVKEKEWSGRDEWYYSLLGDETLADLRVNGQGYTGLTTPLYYAPDEKYVEKMLELLKSDNPTVRAAAIRNLVVKINTKNPEIIRAMIPWLEDPKWAIDLGNARSVIVRELSEYDMPESVPGLIKILNEPEAMAVPRSSANAANFATIVNPTGPMANVMRSSSNVMANTMVNLSTRGASDLVSYPYRSSAVSALSKQKDGRAVPALRRVLTEVQGYERTLVVKAILDCRGFSVTEQLDALDAIAKESRAGTDDSNATVPIPYYYGANASNGPLTAPELRDILGSQLMQSSEISDELARAIVDRIEILDSKDPKLADIYRQLILKWQNAAINIMLLREVKRDRADVDTIVRLLAHRKDLREKQSTDVYDLRTGTSSAVGIAACLLEDTPDYLAILENGDAETKTAMLACARLIRAPLLVEKVAENLSSPAKTLQIAAERYLESEDSPEARLRVLALYPNEAKILGATTAFFVSGVPSGESEYLWMLYQSLGDDSLYNGWSGSGNDEQLALVEKRLQAEVKKDDDLIGIYSYDSHYIRIYKDRVIFSWDEDDSRYRERPLSKYEFEEIKSYLSANRVDELPPFLSCGGDYCLAKELIMLGRNGGRRIYVNGGEEMYTGRGKADFFAGLDKYFNTLKKTNATLKYSLSRDIPGLEILMASDELQAAAVWKDGSDLRVAASKTAVRKKIRDEIEDPDPEGDIANDEGISDQNDSSKAALFAKRRYEGYSWYTIADGKVGSETAQPAQVEFIPVRDSLAVQPNEGNWKARAAGVEIRTSDEGIFKAVRGKLTRLRKGAYRNAAVTPNGRWALAAKSDQNGRPIVVRIDLLTNKEFPIVIEGYGQWYPAAFVPTLNQFLICRDDYYNYYNSRYGFDDEDDVLRNDADPSGMFLVNPANGAVQPIAGEFRPLSQQTFRPLQKAAKPNEFWAAISDPEKNETQVGIYDIDHFGFRAVLRVPKIRFNSMSMWVDEPGGKVYFVYRGHLLSLPLK